MKLGHILRVELKRNETTGVVGLSIEAREHDAPIGYGYPRGKSLWFSFDDPRLTIFFDAIQKPDFRDHHDLIGVEVEMTYDEEVGVLSDLTVSGGKRRYLENDRDRDSREMREGIAKKGDDGMRSRRFYACRTAENMRLVIENLETGDLERGELVNMTNCLLRMILIQNDGQISPQKLQAF